MGIVMVMTYMNKRQGIDKDLAVGAFIKGIRGKNVTH